MRLYELPRMTHFKVDNGEILNHDHQEVFLLDHLDGMYSVCYDDIGQIHHFSVNTPVIKVD
jgi:hypothetical protein